MKHIILYLMPLILSMTFIACESDSINLPYAYDMDKAYNLDIPKETAIYIKSQTEFENLFADNEAKPKTDIPFSDGILMIVKGVSSHGISKVEKTLVPSGNHYNLSICITQNLTTSMETWYVAYIIPYNYIDKVHLDLKYIQ